MRCVVALVILSVVALNNAEQCTVNGDCRSVNCTTGYHVVCEHKQGAGVVTNGGLCTCALDDLTCTRREDCLDKITCISDGHKHCYDNKCICSRW
ncbi:hypothetical protein DPMN_068807 [Dreissena polymorpha]|uniref:Uncharacterized protein n=1 Tax=Dreissena polymorpha TaxID=45954 RepID=A0A9D3Z2B1_DREPO|nr:hypothetical protein DPMN_068807 [Dreissena polymorpha]